MRFVVLSFLALSLGFVPTSARAASVDSVALPQIMQNALLDAAVTGNPLVIDAVADRLARAFPSNKGAIDDFADHVALPASRIAVVMRDMHLRETDAFAWYHTDGTTDHIAEQGGEADAALALAAELNDMDVGAGSSL